jgi:general L-amino acid transport system substrate-binding protein
LAADRLLAGKPDDFVVLPDVISNEPLSLVARPDQELVATLFWSFQVMLWTEKFGVTSKTIDKVVAELDKQPKEVQRLFGQSSSMGDMAAKLGLHKDWAIEIIRQVGNYGEVFERTVGAGTPVGIDRAASLNRLWTDGGLLYAYPIR